MHTYLFNKRSAKNMLALSIGLLCTGLISCTETTPKQESGRIERILFKNKKSTVMINGYTYECLTPNSELIAPGDSVLYSLSGKQYVWIIKVIDPTAYYQTKSPKN